MKISELRKLIKEELGKTLTEGYNIPAQLSSEEFVQTVKDILADLKNQINKAAASAKVTFVDTKDVTRQYPFGSALTIKYEGIQEANKLMNIHNRILADLDDYTTTKSKAGQKMAEQEIRNTIAKL
jgi:hypothetical protein